MDANDAFPHSHKCLETLQEGNAYNELLCQSLIFFFVIICFQKKARMYVRLVSPCLLCLEEK
jgi:hypothetical protein